MGFLICCFKFIACLGCRDSILRKFAFFPPQNSYKIKKKKESTYQINNNSEDNIPIYQMIDQVEQDIELQTIQIIKSYVFLINGRNNRKTTCLFLENKKSNYLLICSHGNSTDISFMQRDYEDMATELDVNILAYEYTGYGDTDQKPSDLDIIMDIEDAYYFALNQLNFEWFNIIAYGQSLGSGPSTFLASNHYTPIGGLILHSPISSGIRILEPETNSTYSKDFFPNVDFIQYVNCPIFIIHGRQDNVIDFNHGNLVYQKSKKKFKPWWVSNAGHNDIYRKYRTEFLVKVKEFVQFIENCVDKAVSVQQLLDQFQADKWEKQIDHFYTEYLKKNTDYYKIQQKKIISKSNILKNKTEQFNQFNLEINMNKFEQ